MDKTEKLIDWDENERTDANRNGIADDIEPPNVDISAGSAKLHHELRDNPGNDPVVTGGDPDARWESAQFNGDEAAVSSMPTPEHNDVDDMGRSMGITYAADEELKVGEKERDRDKKRFELDPASSEDYRERQQDEER